MATLELAAGRLEEALDANRRYVAQCEELLVSNPDNADLPATSPSGTESAAGSSSGRPAWHAGSRLGPVGSCARRAPPTSGA